jgi:hypothetical protein
MKTKEILTLINGVLYKTEEDGRTLQAVYEEADYFSGIEDATRWLQENGSDAKVVVE